MIIELTNYNDIMTLIRMHSIKRPVNSDVRATIIYIYGRCPATIVFIENVPVTGGVLVITDKFNDKGGNGPTK